MRKNELKKIKREEAAAAGEVGFAEYEGEVGGSGCPRGPGEEAEGEASGEAGAGEEVVMQLLQEALVAKRELEIAWEKYQDILEKMYDNSPYQLEGHVYYVEKNEPGSLMRAPPYCLYKVKDKPDE